MSYHKLEIYNVSFELFAEAHQISFVLPKYELHELGSQLRRSLILSTQILLKVMEEECINRIF